MDNDARAITARNEADGIAGLIGMRSRAHMVRPGRRGWAAISLAVLASASLVGCSTVKGAAKTDAAGGTGPLLATMGKSASPTHVSTSPTASKSPTSSKSPSVRTSPTGGNSPSPTSAATGPVADASPSSSPSPSPSATNSNPGTGSECVTSEAKGSCGPYGDSAIAISGGQITVGQDVWNPISGWSQMLRATGPSDWSVTANMPAPNRSVVSFPNIGDMYYNSTTADKLSNFSAIHSSFTEDMHATSATSAWAAYDIWLNSWSNEVMIQVDFSLNGACPAVGSATFGGSGGVPVQHWNLCKYGSELIWKLTGGNEQSGTVDILAMLTWLENHGYLPAGSNLTDISYGWELCSTGGKPETFTLSRFTVTTS
jgi:hypothetical protein